MATGPSDDDEPFENPNKLFDMKDVEPNSEEARRIFKSPAFRAFSDRADAEVLAVADHAENWLNKTQHLHTPEDVASARKLIGHGRRGILWAKELDSHMDKLFVGVYPKFSFSDVPNNIPGHLGPQFGG